MLINWNTRVLNELPEGLHTAQRACWYGDGLFETLRMSNNALPWLPRHWKRLSSGLQALDFDLPSAWNEPFWEKEIKKIASGNARIRLQVWRAPGGLYLPEHSTPVFLITAAPLEQEWFVWPEMGVHVGMADSCRIPVDDYSGFKCLNTARYVAAALEARKKGWDDAVVLNAFERVAEAGAGNIFWWENANLCTVPLSEGCVDGIARWMLLENARDFGLSVHEKSATFAALQTADEIFLTNAIRGITPVASIAGRSLSAVRTKPLFEWFSGLKSG